MATEGFDTTTELARVSNQREAAKEIADCVVHEYSPLALPQALPESQADSNMGEYRLDIHPYLKYPLTSRRIVAIINSNYGE